MEVKRKTKREWRLPRKRLTDAAVLLAIVCFICLGVQYLSFVSRTVYEESTEHLEEILHKSNSMLGMIVNKNISYLHLWMAYILSSSLHLFMFTGLFFFFDNLACNLLFIPFLLLSPCRSF